MKIAIYNVTTANRIGGIETWCWEIGKWLNKLGCEVHIISGEGDLIKYPELSIFLFPYIQREKFPDLGRRFRKFMERFSFFYYARALLKKEKFDVFIITKPFDFFVAYYVKKINSKCITVFYSGGEDFWYVDKIFKNAIDVWIAVSQSNKEILEKRYNKFVRVIPNGVDIEEFKPDEKKALKIRKKFNLENKKVILSVGRVVGWKGYQNVIKALCEEKLKDFVYVIVGDGEYLEELKRLVKFLNLQERVIFLGKKAHYELSGYYLLGDVFIQPSIGYEAFGIVLIEAMACGLPVVGSSSGGIKELIKNGENGYLIDNPLDIEEISKKIFLAFENRENLGKRGREFVEKNYSWKKIAERFLKEIRSYEQHK